MKSLHKRQVSSYCLKLLLCEIGLDHMNAWFWTASSLAIQNQAFMWSAAEILLIQSTSRTNHGSIKSTEGQISNGNKDPNLRCNLAKPPTAKQQERCVRDKFHNPMCSRLVQTYFGLPYLIVNGNRQLNSLRSIHVPILTMVRFGTLSLKARLKLLLHFQSEVPWMIHAASSRDPSDFWNRFSANLNHPTWHRETVETAWFIKRYETRWYLSCSTEDLCPRTNCTSSQAVPVISCSKNTANPFLLIVA